MVDIDPDFCKKYERLLELKSILSSNTECKLWNTGCLSSYGQVKVRFTKQSYKVIYVHRLAYFLHVGDISALQTNTSEQCSHTCHNTKCINPEHISLESSAINLQRQTCIQNQKCFGHGHKLDRRLDLMLYGKVKHYFMCF